MRVAARRRDELDVLRIRQVHISSIPADRLTTLATDLVCVTDEINQVNLLSPVSTSPLVNCEASIYMLRPCSSRTEVRVSTLCLPSVRQCDAFPAPGSPHLLPRVRRRVTTPYHSSGASHRHYFPGPTLRFLGSGGMVAVTAA